MYCSEMLDTQTKRDASDVYLHENNLIKLSYPYLSRSTVEVFQKFRCASSFWLIKIEYIDVVSSATETTHVRMPKRLANENKITNNLKWILWHHNRKHRFYLFISFYCHRFCHNNELNTHAAWQKPTKWPMFEMVVKNV